ncbi:MAG: twin-arginine translocase TatA/TatE family subunit [Oricola sp.]|nr:twin-arginine translocase TatA/TatE family subunit [Oricola sp.]
MNLLPQFGFFELVLVAVVALIVVGPKDLPRLMR